MQVQGAALEPLELVEIYLCLQHGGIYTLLDARSCLIFVRAVYDLRCYTNELIALHLGPFGYFHPALQPVGLGQVVNPELVERYGSPRILLGSVQYHSSRGFGCLHQFGEHSCHILAHALVLARYQIDVGQEERAYLVFKNVYYLVYTIIIENLVWLDFYSKRSIHIACHRKAEVIQVAIPLDLVFYRLTVQIEGFLRQIAAGNLHTVPYLRDVIDEISVHLRLLHALLHRARYPLYPVFPQEILQ